MSTGYYHTDESARDTLREYRDTNGYDTFAEAIDSMRECIDDLDDEEKSALLHLESTSALIYDLYFTPRKVIKRWCIAIQWSDGTSEERTDVPDLRDLEDCMDEWEEEANK